jgi:hypothetical protein
MLLLLLNTAKCFRRQAAKALLQPSDVVLEVDCCGGMKTSNLRNDKPTLLCSVTQIPRVH